MTELKGIGRRRTQLLDDLRIRIWHWEQKEEAEDRKKYENYSLSIEHKEEIDIFRKSMGLLISSILNNNINNNSNNNNNNNNNNEFNDDLLLIRNIIFNLFTLF